jgi:hypothetical protein
MVRDHDFLSEADGKAIPYGIYDLVANSGMVVVGNSRETAEFAVDSLVLWWQLDGSIRYPSAHELLILADGGGGNGATNRAWKHGLYHQLARPHDLRIVVAHYPPGTSKWNPIEHRLFSEISKNWSGRPLDSFETMLNCIRTTTTRTGLHVTAHLMDRPYQARVRISDARMRELPITRHESLPRWNYTIASALGGAAEHVQSQSFDAPSPQEPRNRRILLPEPMALRA